MRSKTKANLSGQLKLETLEKLKQIGRELKLNQIKTVEFLIENYQAVEICQTHQPIAIIMPIDTPTKEKFKREFREAKSTQKEPSMAELLKQTYSSK